MHQNQLQVHINQVKCSQVESVNDGLGPTCTVLYKLLRPINNNNRNTVNDVVCKEVRVPVQRLVIILPVEEQQKETLDLNSILNMIVLISFKASNTFSNLRF